MRESFATGQEVVPAYEGWEPNPDGSFNLVFGYFNRNWEEEIDIPPGPNNRLEPGGPDLGQPTRFLPRRNRFLFKVHVPADFGDGEVVWTLTSPNGETKRAYGTLHPDYFIDNSVLMANNGGGASGDIYKNQPPELVLVGETKRKARVGEWVTLAAYASDDELPRPRAMRRFDPTKPPVNVTPNAATGLRMSWFVYRAATEGPLQSAAVQGLGGHAQQRRLALLARLEDARGAPDGQVGGAGEIRCAGHVHPARPRPRRRPDGARGRDLRRRVAGVGDPRARRSSFRGPSGSPAGPPFGPAGLFLRPGGLSRVREGATTRPGRARRRPAP